MVWQTSALGDVKTILKYGGQVRINHYTGSVSVDKHDDAQKLTLSGSSVWTSGLVLPLTSLEGSEDAVLMQQGKIKTSDKKIFFAGDVEMTDTMKFSLGSPIGSTTESFSIVPGGVSQWPGAGTAVYKKVYVRYLPTGSLIGEGYS